MLSIVETQRPPETYKQTELLLGMRRGLIDSIHRDYPKIWSLYKEMKSLDWSEDEFKFAQCLVDFEQAPKDLSDIMIETLAVQWEGDTWAANSILEVFGPFVSSTELWCAWCRIVDNENIHSLTYSEIVKMSFKDPDAVLGRILEVHERRARLAPVTNAFNELYKYANMYRMRQIEADNPELIDAVYVGVATLFCLERIQFMASFAVTFTIAATGLFQAIAKAVQKIAQDELEVHCEVDKEILGHCRTNSKNFDGVHERTAEKIAAIVGDVIEAELHWNREQIFKNDTRSIPGLTNHLLDEWVLFNAKPLIDFLSLNKFFNNYKFPKANPLPHMNQWLDMNKLQPAPQEQDSPNYKIGVVLDDSASINFDYDL